MLCNGYILLLLIATLWQKVNLYINLYSQFTQNSVVNVNWHINNNKKIKNRNVTIVRRLKKGFLGYGWGWSSSAFFRPIRHVESPPELGPSNYLIGCSAGEPVHEKSMLLGRQVLSVGMVRQGNFGPRRCRSWPEHVWRSAQYYKVQGFFIRHIINYTGYNQKWNVNQIRSAQWTVQKNKNKN